jgi:hypothetical protein
VSARSTIRRWPHGLIAGALAGLLAMQASSDVMAQARAARRGSAVKTEEGGAAVRREGASATTQIAPTLTRPTCNGRASWQFLTEKRADA